MPPNVRKMPPPAERRAILRVLSNTLGAKAPARVFPQGLPTLKAIGPHTRVEFVEQPVPEPSRPPAMQPNLSRR
jgi:hypothetical protein